MPLKSQPNILFLSVITLTTAGLGDFVPTTDFNKIICSIFIYFGVACIGLLLGSYIASMMDETSRLQARDNRLNSCPNCIRLQNLKDAAERRDMLALASSLRGHELQMHFSENLSKKQHHEGFFPAPGTASERFEHDISPFSTGNKKIKRKHHAKTVAQARSHPLVAKTPLKPAVQKPSTIPETEVVDPSIVTEQPAAEPATFATGRDKSSPQASSDPTEETPNQHKANIADTNRKSLQLPPPQPALGVINSYSSWSEASLTSQKSPFSRTSPSEIPTTPKQSPRSFEQGDLLGSPLTKQILGRQSHTRHASIDINGGFSFQNMGIPGSMHETPVGRTPTISENTPFVPGTHNSDPLKQHTPRLYRADSTLSDLGLSLDDSSVSSSSSFDSSESDGFQMKRRVKTAKYVFLTLKEALVNSMAIIALGCLGFWFVEGFSLVDSKSRYTL